MRKLLPHRHHLSAAAVLIALTPVSVFSQAETSPKLDVLEAQFIQDVGAAERVALADRLRTISWELPAAACNLYNDVNPELNAKLLEDVRLEARSILSALRNGDDAQNVIGAEKNAKLLTAMDRVDEVWTRVDAAALTLLDDPKSTETIKLIKGDAPNMFDQSYALLSDVSGVYSNPGELLQADALLLDIAGRQSMLTQKIAALACEVWTGYGDEVIDAELQTSIDMFEMGVTALRDGMPALGIAPAPTQEISDRLTMLISDWQEVKAKLEKIQSGAADNELMSGLDEKLVKKMHAADEIVLLYSTYAKQKGI